jgi:AraC family L-rhamnose operon transcriptional activator RhaR
MISGLESLRTFAPEDVFGTDAAPAFATIADYPPTPTLEPHAHEYLEIVVMIEGHGVHLSSKGPFEMVPGSVVAVRPGAWHGFGDSGAGRAVWIGVSLGALSTDLSFIRGRVQIRELLYTGPFTKDSHGVWTTRISESAAHRVAEEATRLTQSIDERAGELIVVGQLIRMLGALSVEFSVTDSPHAVHPSVALLLDLLDAAPQRNWSMPELGARVNLDTSYLSRVFRAQIGIPPMAYLARLRAERAAGLLTATDLPIAQIGRRVGWPEPTHFSRRFHRLIGLTPSEYRRRLSEPISGPDRSHVGQQVATGKGTQDLRVPSDG